MRWLYISRLHLLSVALLVFFYNIQVNNFTVQGKTLGLWLQEQILDRVRPGPGGIVFRHAPGSNEWYYDFTDGALLRQMINMFALGGGGQNGGTVVYPTQAAVVAAIDQYFRTA